MIPEYASLCKTLESAQKVQKKWLGLGLRVQISPVNSKVVSGDNKYIVEGWER